MNAVRVALIFYVASLLCVRADVAASTARHPAPTVARLADDAAPVAYDLTLAPNLETARTAGSATVEIRVRRRMDALALNARDIVVSSATIDGRPARVQTFAKVQQIRLDTGAPLSPGMHRASLTFVSRLDDGHWPGGLLRDFAGDVSTFFEPSTARTVFPCFDEPQFRARFTLHVRAPSAWTVVSNMPLTARTELGDGLAQSDFATSPPMPAYVLTLDGGDYVHIDGMAGTLPLRVFVKAGEEDHARVVVADLARLVPFYERFFGTPYPLPKLDVVVANGALQSALEGWGAITFYSEGEIFGQQYEGGERGRRYAVEVLAHEVAHQWSGDLVSMRWWRDTFVAEGVAEFAQRRATAAVFPELRTWLDDDRDVQSVMEAPIVKGVKPAVSEVATDLNADAWRAFSGATYDKGASVIDGWRVAVGDTTFASGLRRYITSYAYRSARFEDFWTALGGTQALAYAESWLTQPGFPIIDVRTRCDDGSQVVSLSQTPFFSDPQVGAAYRKQRWMLPIHLRVAGSDRRVMLTGRSATIRFRGCGDVALDPGERPYYVTRYEPAAYPAVIRATVDERDRERLIRDSIVLYAGRALDDASYLRVTASAHEPLDPRVWQIIARSDRWLKALARDTPEEATLAELVRGPMLPFAERYDHVGSAGGHAPFRLDYDPADALGAGGDVVAGARFHADYLAMLGGGSSPVYQASWLIPQLAAAAATADDVARTETALRAVRTSPISLTPNEWMFLANVGDAGLAARTLADVMRDPGLNKGCALAFLSMAAQRHPSVAYVYLRAHLDELRRGFPPTQQAPEIANVVAQTLWPAAPATELDQLLRTTFPADRTIVTRAAVTIEQYQHRRRSLLQALHEPDIVAAASASGSAVSP